MDILENLGISHSEWVECCYKERMKQILTDPAEFGKVVFESKRRGHLILVNDEDLDDY